MTQPATLPPAYLARGRAYSRAQAGAGARALRPGAWSLCDAQCERTQVPGDLDLRWDPLGSLLSDIACQPYPRTAPPTTSSPAAPAPGLLGLAPADDAQQAQQDACFGECDRVRVTLFARRGVRSSNAAPASTLQQSRDGRAARQQSVVLTPAPASGPLQASGHVPALPRAAVAEPEGTGEDTGGVATGQASATAHTAGPQAAPEPVPAIASQPPSPAGEATDDQLDSNRASEGLTVLVSITVGQGGTCEVAIVLQPQHSVTANGICSPAACQPSAEPAQSSHTQTRAPASDGCASSPAQTAFSQPAEPPSAHKSLAQQGACNTDGSTQEGHRAALETPKQQDAAAQLSPQPTMTDWVGNGPAPGHTQSKQAQSAINDDDDTFIVCQLQFRSSDLIAVGKHSHDTLHEPNLACICTYIHYKTVARLVWKHACMCASCMCASVWTRVCVCVCVCVCRHGDSLLLSTRHQPLHLPHHRPTHMPPRERHRAARLVLHSTPTPPPPCSFRTLPTRPARKHTKHTHRKWQHGGGWPASHSARHTSGRRECRVHGCGEGGGV